jgi:hypothetical protein
MGLHRQQIARLEDALQGVEQLFFGDHGERV